MALKVTYTIAAQLGDALGFFEVTNDHINTCAKKSQSENAVRVGLLVRATVRQAKRNVHHLRAPTK